MQGGATLSPSKAAWINALATLPDGRLMVGGSFSKIGTTVTTSVAAWDGTQWSALGTGLPGGEVSAIAMPSGGEPVVNVGAQVFQLKGPTWTPLGVAMSGPVYALAAAPNDVVYAGGQFTWAGGVPALNIGYWNGVAWCPLGTGITGAGAAVSAVVVMPNGDVIAAGKFSSAGGVSSLNIARWNGSEWSSLGGTNASPSALMALASGDLLVSGAFTSAGGVGVRGVARWDGTAWSQFGKPFVSYSAYKKTGLTLVPGGDLFVSAQLADSSGVWLTRWNGTDFVPLSDGSEGTIHQMRSTSSGDVLAAGMTRFLDGQAIFGVARWNGEKWSPVGSLGGLSSQTFFSEYDVDEMANGDIVAVGGYKLSDGTSTPAIRFDGQAWSSMVTSFSGDLYAVRALQGNRAVVGGWFSGIDGVPANGVAIWDPTNGWMTMGAGISKYARAVEELPNGDIVAAGNFAMAGGKWMGNVGRWDGTEWWPMGNLVYSPGSASVVALKVLADGTLVAGGLFDNRIAAWNGTDWLPLGGGLKDLISAIEVLDNGDVLAGGISFATTSSVHRFDGASWTPLSTVDGSVAALAIDRHQSVLVGGFFSTVGTNVVSERYAVFGCPAGPACYPDCDQSGSLDIDDFICFQTLYAIGEAAADCDGSGALDIDDFICFQTAYAIGC